MQDYIQQLPAQFIFHVAFKYHSCEGLSSSLRWWDVTGHPCKSRLICLVPCWSSLFWSSLYMHTRASFCLRAKPLQSPFESLSKEQGDKDSWEHRAGETWPKGRSSKRLWDRWHCPQTAAKPPHVGGLNPFSSFHYWMIFLIHSAYGNTRAPRKMYGSLQIAHLSLPLHQTGVKWGRVDFK